jgi:hypothetical protein
VAAAALAAVGTAGAQTTPPASQPIDAPVARENPGLVNEIGKLLKDPSSLLPDFAKPESAKPDPRPDARPPETPAPERPQAAPAAAPQPAPTPAPNPAPPPPAAPSASPTMPSMINGRQLCPAAPNGSPDCAAGAAILCRSKGYQSGRSLAIDATEKCSAKLLIPGRAREPGDCRTENFVTRAWCQ